MTYGQIVAKRFKRQYFKRKAWKTYDDWDISPEETHLILLELKTKAAIAALVGRSWTKRLPRRTRLK